MFPCRYGRRNVVNLLWVFSPCALSPGVVGVGFVGSDSGCGREHALCGVLGVWVTSPRPISTGRLGIAAVHLRPINPVVCGWPYPILWVGNLILKCASRLDAFSGYHVRT